MVASSLHLVVIRLGAGGPANGRVGEVHVWRHGGWVRWASGLRVSEIIGRPRRGHAAMRRGGPSEACHVGASVDAVGAMIAGSRRLQRLRWGIGMRGHRWANMGGTAIARKRGRCRSRGSSGAALGEIPAHVRRNGPSAHVVVASGSMHVQWGQFTTG